MNTQFAKFLQIGYIVENVEETIKHYEEYGIGPWRVSPLDSAEFPDFTMNGKRERLQTIMAFCDCWGFELELIQPISDSPYMDWLKEHGSGMHHIALITRDSFEEVLAEHKEKTGRDPWLWCKDPKIGMEFAYLDLAKELGMFLEVYNEEKHGGLPADFRLPEETK
jgi:methylmalonyl-CoA/ethylmalonyl-CoA epimerase